MLEGKADRMISKEKRAELQRTFDELAAKYDTDEAQRRLAGERRIRLAPLVRKHQQLLARSRENAGHRVIR